MKECRHKWIITEWITNIKPYKRYCKKCGKKQKRQYHGGNMWYWITDD